MRRSSFRAILGIGQVSFTVLFGLRRGSAFFGITSVSLMFRKSILLSSSTLTRNLTVLLTNTVLALLSNSRYPTTSRVQFSSWPAFIKSNRPTAKCSNVVKVWFNTPKHFEWLHIFNYPRCTSIFQITSKASAQKNLAMLASSSMHFTMLIRVKLTLATLFQNLSKTSVALSVRIALIDRPVCFPTNDLYS